MQSPAVTPIKYWNFRATHSRRISRRSSGIYRRVDGIEKADRSSRSVICILCFLLIRLPLFLSKAFPFFSFLLCNVFCRHVIHIKYREVWFNLKFILSLTLQDVRMMWENSVFLLAATSSIIIYYYTLNAKRETGMYVLRSIDPSNYRAACRKSNLK